MSSRRYPEIPAGDQFRVRDSRALEHPAKMAPVRDNFLLLLVGLLVLMITAPPQAKTISAVTARVGHLPCHLPIPTTRTEENFLRCEP